MKIFKCKCRWQSLKTFLSAITKVSLVGTPSFWVRVNISMNTFRTSLLLSIVRCPPSKSVATLDQPWPKTNCQKLKVWEMRSSHLSTPNLPISIKINPNQSFISVMRSLKVRCKIYDKRRLNNRCANNPTFHLNQKYRPITNYSNLPMRRESTRANAISHSHLNRCWSLRIP